MFDEKENVVERDNGSLDEKYVTRSVCCDPVRDASDQVFFNGSQPARPHDDEVHRFVLRHRENNRSWNPNFKVLGDLPALRWQKGGGLFEDSSAFFPQRLFCGSGKIMTDTHSCSRIGELGNGNGVE